jgi:Domain of unknown function (DUF4158)/Tn3 transposase DDE domain
MGREGLMATRVFSDEELEGLRSFPAIGKDELIRYFTLTSADQAFLGTFRRAQNVLGAAIQLSTLPWLGFVPDDVPSAPPAVVGRLARQLGVAVADLAGYGERGQTCTDHLREIAGYLSWKPAKAIEFKELDEFLLARAMEHDSPSLLFRLGCEYLRSAKVIRPGVVLLLEKVGTARQAAEKETHGRVAHLLTGEQVRGLDGLLVVEPALGSTRLHWMVTGPVQGSPTSVKGEVEKLLFLRGLGADVLDLSALPAERRRCLAQIGRRLTAQALVRREPNRRHPILLTLLAQSAVDVLDSVVRLFDQTLSGSESRAKIKLREVLAERTKLSEDRLALLDEILPVLADTGIPDEEVGTLLRGKIGMSRLRAAHDGATVRLPRDHGHPALLEGSYTYIRQFAPKVLETVRFKGGTEAKPLIEALGILRELNATGARNVPEDAPTLFVPTRWQGYLDEAAAKGDATAYRHYGKLCTLLALRDGLRSGDVYVPGSRRYDNPAAYLFKPAQWETHRDEFCRLVGKGPDFSEALPLVMDELDEALTDLEGVLKRGNGPVRLNDAGELVISPLMAEDIPSEAEELHGELDEDAAERADRLAAGGDGPAYRVPELLHPCRRQAGPFPAAQKEPDRLPDRALHQPRTARDGRVLRHPVRRVGVDRGVVHLGGDAARGQHLPGQLPPQTADDDHVRLRHAVVLRRAAVPDAGQADHRPASEQVLRLGGHLDLHPRLRPALHLRYEGHRGHAPRGPYVLDEILGNATDLPISEHATDTHGVTLVNFGLFDLVGKQLSPRIRDLGKITLYRMGAKADYEEGFPTAGPLLTKKANLDLVADHWDDLLRLAGSLKYGPATASLIVAQAVRVLPAERTGRRVEGVRGDPQSDLCGEVPVGRGLPPQDRPPAEQGRVPARPAPPAPLRPRGQGRPAPARAAERAGVVPDRRDQQRGLLAHRVPGPGRR